jgi:UDP-glucose 4-epimerase
MSIIIAGGAGFIGSNLAYLLSKHNKVIVIDNLSRGDVEFLPRIDNVNIFFYQYDLSKNRDANDAFSLASRIEPITEIWHLAANSDIPAGVANHCIDLKDTFMSTVEILAQVKKYNIPSLLFASTSAIYGDLGELELHEDIGPLLPVSNYGAMKLASEALISAATESYLKRALIFRFPNVVGTPATHGVIYDFINKLKTDQLVLNVLGDGSQQKSYLHVSDLISAMLQVRDTIQDKKINVMNIGPTDDGVSVKWIAEKVIERVSPSALIVYGSGNRGWVGDVPKFKYSTAKLQSYGWRPKLNSEHAILRAIDEISNQLGV